MNGRVKEYSIPRQNRFEDLTYTGTISPGAQSKVEGNWIPDTDDNRDLGDATHRWRNLFLNGDVNFSDKTANTVFSGPASGAAAAPTFRTLADADIPAAIARDSEAPAVGDIAGSLSAGYQIVAGSVVDADVNATGITTRSKLPSALAYEDEANVFSLAQLPSATGIDLGSATARWDLLGDVVTTGVLNNIRVVDGNKFTTIQAALNDAGAVIVLVPDNYAGANETSIGDGQIVLDFRSGILEVRRNRTTTAAGEAVLRIEEGAVSQINPTAGDFVGVYAAMASSASRIRVWAMNPLVDIPLGADATAWGLEVNVNNNAADAPNPRNTLHKMGVDIVSGGSFKPSAALGISNTVAANRWKHGIWIDGASVDQGITFNGQLVANGQWIVFPVGRIDGDATSMRVRGGGTAGTLQLLGRDDNLAGGTVSVRGGDDVVFANFTDSDTATKRLRTSLATALVAGDFALSAGWGNTASVGSIRGVDQYHEFTVTSAGTGQGANPTITLTYKDGTWTTAPVVLCNRQEFASQPTVTVSVTTQSATTYVLTFNGTPAAAETYRIAVHAGGI